MGIFTRARATTCTWRTSQHFIRLDSICRKFCRIFNARHAWIRLIGVRCELTSPLLFKLRAFNENESNYRCYRPGNAVSDIYASPTFAFILYSNYFDGISFEQSNPTQKKDVDAYPLTFNIILLENGELDEFCFCWKSDIEIRII